MTVVDTKALEVGSLLGHMLTCEACQTDFYAGFPKCPKCGALPPKARKRTASGVGGYHPGSAIGDDLIASYESLFEKAFAAWYSGRDGYLSCGLGFERGTLVIMPPMLDEFYRLVRVPKGRGDTIEHINHNADVASLIEAAGQIIQARGAVSTTDKEASWREQPATAGQLRLIKRLRIDAPPSLSKGSASQLITHTLAVRRLEREEVLT